MMIPARNWNPQQPTGPTLRYKLPLDAEGEIDFVWPGMVITLKADGSRWQVGVPAGETPSVVAIAQDPTFGNKSEGVRLSDSLVGFPLTSPFRIVTPFFKRGVAYPAGTKLTYCVNSEDIKDGLEKKILGAVRPAAAGEPVIGVVTRTYEDSYYTVGNRGTTNTEQALALQIDIDRAMDSQSVWQNAYVIEFDSCFKPENPAGGA